MKIAKTLIFILVGTLVLYSCGGKKFTKSPVDEIMRDMPAGVPFSIVLHDMEVEGSFFEHYFHQYEIIANDSAATVDGEKVMLPSRRLTEFKEVSEDYFKMQANNMGMEVASRDSSGNVSKGVNPPGYSNYVGNRRYGRWVQRDGNSFWEFYGKYAFMRSMFNMMAYPVRRSYYDDWRGNYYGTGRTYYGPRTGGTSYYGTGSAYTRSSRPNSSWSNNQSRFKRRVQERTSRSGSRYSGSSSRSRGGGFGK